MKPFYATQPKNKLGFYNVVLISSGGLKQKNTVTSVKCFKTQAGANNLVEELNRNRGYSECTIA